MTGGGRGITAACLRALADQVTIKIAILGRTSLEEEADELASCQSESSLFQALLANAQHNGESATPAILAAQVRRIIAVREIRQTLRELEERGATVSYVAVDVCDSQAVAEAVQTVRQTLGPIRVLIHGAGVSIDKYIHEKSRDQFMQVWQTKVLGLQHLLAATEMEPLTHISCFSSMVALTGNPGQADYGMANAMLNALCQVEYCRRQGACAVKALNWGPWEGGMVRPELQTHFAAMGIPLIPLENGARHFVRELQEQAIDEVEVVLGGLLPAALEISAELSWDMWLHQSTVPLLGSHQIQGVPVVPVVLVVDWCQRLAAALYPTLHVRAVKQIAVLKGIRVPQWAQEGLWLQWQGLTRRDKETVELQLTLQGVDGKPHYRATIDLASSIGRRDHLHERQLDCLVPWQGDVQTLYPDKLFHGPELQVVDRLEGISDKGCVSMLTLPSENNQMGEQACQIAILDGGLQLAALWGIERLQHASLPTSIDRYECYHPFPSDNSVRCELHLTAVASTYTRWDILYRNSEGEVLAQLAGLTMLLLPDAHGLNPTSLDQAEEAHA